MNSHLITTSKAIVLAAIELDERQPWLARQHMIAAWNHGLWLRGPECADLPAQFLALLVRKAIIETQQRTFNARVHQEIERVVNRNRRRA